MREYRHLRVGQRWRHDLHGERTIEEIHYLNFDELGRCRPTIQVDWSGGAASRHLEDADLTRSGWSIIE